MNEIVLDDVSITLPTSTCVSVTPATPKQVWRPMVPAPKAKVSGRMGSR